METEKQSSPLPESSSVPVTPLNTDKSHEAFLGSLLVFVLVILFLGILGFFSFLGYRVYRQNQVVRNTPSIEHLASEKNIVASGPIENVDDVRTPPVTDTTVTAPVAPAPIPAINKAGLQIKVLNGGTVKGVAGTVAEALKKAGYTKVTVGNSFGDYTGASIYYAKGKNVEAEVLKADLIKEYPKITIQEALASDKDANAATLVVILGK